MPLVQEVTVETTVLQTPANEERSRKRDRQEETPLSADQPGEKRQRLNHFSEEQMPVRPTVGMGPPSTEASSSSFQHEHDR